METPTQTAQPVASTDLFAIECDPETYLIRDECGKNRMAMMQSGSGPWKLYRIGEGDPIDHDTFRHDLLERHGIRIANVEAHLTAEKGAENEK
jgi:hypothetical protein